MKVFITGATGYIGTVVSAKLRNFGHQVIGLARSESSARKLENAGALAIRGDLRDVKLVSRAAREADAAIHLAQERSSETAQLDRDIIDPILEEFRLTGRPFLYTSGVWVMGNTGSQEADETAPLDPPAFVAWRLAHEQMVLEAQGPRGVVIRPAMVYGHGGGFTGDFQHQARANGMVRHVGAGNNRWSFVHVDDLAALYVLALQAPAGSLYLASAGTALPVQEVARAAAAPFGATVESIPIEEARQSMGPMADALVLDQAVSARKAMRELGWAPQGRSVLEELSNESEVT